MKKHIFLVLSLIVILIPMLSGCGVKKLSGTYVSELDKSVYAKFSGESKIVYHDGNGSRKGTYRIDRNTVYASFPATDSGEDSFMVFEVKDKKTIYYGLTVAFVKKGFLEKHWKKIVIAVLVWGVISAVYEKITGRSLEDDIDKL